MDKTEIEKIIAKKIEAHLDVTDLQVSKPGKPKQNHVYLHLIIGGNRLRNTFSQVL